MSADHVLGAVVVAAVMLSAVTFVVTFEPRDSASEAQVAALLETQARDFLSVYRDWPIDAPCLGKSMLERFLLEGLRGQSSTWNKKTKKFFPIGTGVSLLLNNGHSLYPMQEKYHTEGATEDSPYQGDWNSVHVISGVDGADGTNAISGSLIAFRNAELLAVRGEPVQVSITGTSGGNPIAERAWGLTALPEPRHHAKSSGVFWSDGESHSLMRVLEVASIAPGATAIAFSVEFPIAASAASSDGLHAELMIPSGWTDFALASPAWVEIARSVTEGTLIVELRLTASSQAVPPIVFYARAPELPSHPFDTLTVRVNNGSLSESTLVVRYPWGIERDLPRAVYTTTPYPLSHGSTATFGAVVANGGPAVNVTRVEIAVPGGYDLHHNDGAGAPLFAKWADDFKPETHGTAHSGTWKWESEKLLVWRGDVAIGQGAAQQWLIDIPITSDTDVVTSIEPRSSRGATATLSFENGFEARATSWGPTPGMIRVRVPPDDLSTPDVAEGYPWAPVEAPEGESDAPAASLERPVGLRVALPWATLDDTTTYTTVPDGGDVVNLESALSNSTFAVKDRLVPVGKFVQVDANLESVMTDLSKRGVDDTTFTVDLYAPPHVGCEPTRTLTLSQGSLPAAGARAVALWDAEGLGRTSLFLGADDARVYRIDGADASGLAAPEGLQRWSAQLPAAARVLRVVDYGGGERHLLVGDASGTLTALRAITGERVWSFTAMGAVVDVSANVTQGRVLFVTEQGVARVLDARTGLQEGETWGADTGSSLAFRVGWGPDGSPLVRSAAKVHRLSFDLSTSQSGTLAGTGDLVLVGGRVRAAGTTSIRSIDYATLSDAAEDQAHPMEEVVLSAAGDLTGDGVPDLVTVGSSLTMRAWDGATSAPLWTSLPVGDEEIAQDLAALAEKVLVTPLERTTHAGCADVSIERYTLEASCALTSPDGTEETLRAAKPLLAHVSSHGVVLAYQKDGAAAIAVVEADGGSRWERALKVGALPLAVERGEWAGRRAVLVSTDDGLIRIFDADAHRPATAAAMYQHSPAAHLGQFSLHIPVPSGGFYGAHLLVATIAWVDDAGHTRSARLSDWFVAVGADGKPVVEPAYRIVLVVDPPDD